tara:strand:+ start:526 stop:750 length:225 start_codon:yes stop_codon:yes gene_type:complete
MVKIGWIGSQLNTFHLGSPNVGKQPSMNEYARVIITVNFGGTFVMNEGQSLIMIMVIAVTFTLALNIVLQGIIG